ncbi:MAG TPA: TetR/AcrR family transcriptional regulator [Burkholderiaceae bacterium]
MRKSSEPDLSHKKRPTQQRAAATYERILEIAAQALADVGIERLSTNIVCERAGLTPPALYRYFPNKYALLCELGRRLMQAQNECVASWASVEVFRGSADELAAALQGLLIQTYEVTAQMVGGVWIMRAMRAVPAMQQVRLESHAQVTQAQVEMLAAAFPAVPREQLRLVSRIVVELIYSTVEMLFDEEMDISAVAHTVASMMASYLPQLQQKAAANIAAARKPRRPKAE